MIVITVSHTWIYKSSLCINKLVLSTLLAEWVHSSDHSILLWPPQCGDGTPPGRGHHQHHCTGEIQTPPCHGLKFGVIRFTLGQILPETYIPGSCFCLHQKFCAVWCILLLIINCCIPAESFWHLHIAGLQFAITLHWLMSTCCPPTCTHEYTSTNTTLSRVRQAFTLP